MSSMHFVGLDVHKKMIAFCVKTPGGRLREEGSIEATPESLDAWVARRRQPWTGAMEATLFTGWIYDHLKPHARELKVAHPLMLRAIACSKKKNDRVDAEKIADLLRCGLLPECYMMPADLRELRRVLRYRNLLVREAVRMHNKSAGLLMETGTPYVKKRLKGKRYFEALLDKVEEVPSSVRELLRMSRGAYEMFQKGEKKLVRALKSHDLLRERVELLSTIDGVGEVTALTWALEIGDPHRFGGRRQAVSYCGLCGAQEESAGKTKRTPISKQRNKHLQTVLVEAANLAPRWNRRLAAVHERELRRGNKNRATLAVARQLVALLLAVDKSGVPYEAERHLK